MEFDSEVPIKINKISIQGIKKSNDEFIKKQIIHEELFNITSIYNLKNRLTKLVNRLESLQIFESIKITLDKSDNDTIRNEHKANLNLIVQVKEKEVENVGLKAIFGLDNSVGANLKIYSNNLTGRAEKLDINIHHNFHDNGGGSISFLKPLEQYPLVNFMIGIWDDRCNKWWSKFVDYTRGGFAACNWISKFGKHQVRAESFIREINVNDDTPLQIKTEAGNSLRASLKHEFITDNKYDSVFPSNSYYVMLNQEIFSDLIRVNSTNNQLINVNLSLGAEIHKSIAFKRFVFEHTINMGIIKSLTKSNTHVSIADRYILGGPLFSRGFQLGGIGERTDVDSNDTNYCLGSNSFIQQTFHVYSEIPIINQWYIGHFMRLHGFFNTILASNAINDQSRILRGDWKDKLDDTWNNYARCGVGFGIVMKLFNIIRLELNYCVPLKYIHGDKLSGNFQFGIGAHYS